MRTLGDTFKSGWNKYIAFSQPKKNVGNKEKHLYTPTQYSEELYLQGYKELSPERRRDIANESPLFMKGIRKKSLDTFRAWHTIETKKGRGKPIYADLIAIESFDRRSNFKYKCYEARVASHIYGNGFLLITFLNDGEKRSLSSKPLPKAEPYTVNVLNSEYINNMKESENGEICYVFLKDGDEKLIHPDRVIHFPANKIPGFALGVSTIDILRHTMFSKKNIDIAAGHILSWFSHGLIDVTWEDMEENEKKEMEKLISNHPGAYIHDQDVEVDVKNPTSIDPKPFYDYVVLNIAAAINMPTHILTGIQTGRVTGSEIGFGDYYRDVKDEQEIEFTPKLENLYARILKARGRDWKYNIIWNTIYIDEMSEAKLLEIRVNAAEKAMNGTKGAGGFIDMEEAREILNKGQISVDANKKIKRVKPLTPPKPEIPKPPVRPDAKKNEQSEYTKAKKEELDKLEKLLDDRDNRNGKSIRFNKKKD